MDDEFTGIIDCEEHLSPSEKKSAFKRWHKVFLEALAQTSNVSLAQKKCLISLAHIYRQRRQNPEFARQWLIALCEGYDNLEMEVLGRLRAGESRDPTAVRHDNGTALRLLAQHRANAERGRALRAHDDEQVTLDSIDALFREMRERAAANDKILAIDFEDEADAGD